MMKNQQILRGSLENLNDISELFSEYHEFYGVNSNKTTSKEFIKLRLVNGDSVIFVAYENNIACGFAQLYFTFSSLAMSSIIILNDLYVSKEYRKKGIANQLMKAVKDFAISHSYPIITLSTSKYNGTAQSLYEKEGYVIDNEFIYYSLNLNNIKQGRS